MLLSFLRPELVEEVTGDLDEKFQELARKRSVRAARLNYWYQVLHYLRPFAIRKTQNLSNYEYRTDMHWWFFIVPICVALLVTLLTVSFQAVRAALMNPVRSLRSE